MDQISQSKIDGTVENKKSTNNSPILEIKRTFRAPVERVWQAWSDSNLIKHWWGPEGFTAPSITSDFKIGGQYIFAMKDQWGKTMWSTGLYEKIVPFKKIVCTDHFSDKNGKAISAKEAGMMENWPEILYITIEFEKTSKNETRIHLSHEGVPIAAMNDCTQGWSTSLDKLQILVERN